MSGPLSAAQETQAELLTRWQEENNTYLFPCAGLNSCQTLIEWPGYCRDCQALANDAQMDAQYESDPYERYYGDES